MIGLLGGYAKEPKELADDSKVWKVELEKQIACVETNEQDDGAGGSRSHVSFGQPWHQWPRLHWQER